MELVQLAKLKCQCLVHIINNLNDSQFFVIALVHSMSSVHRALHATSKQTTTSTSRLILDIQNKQQKNTTKTRIISRPLIDSSGRFQLNENVILCLVGYIKLPNISCPTRFLMEKK